MRKPNHSNSGRALISVLLLGSVSTVLYILLFIYAQDIITLAGATREGHPWYALIPIAIALVFSLVHGAFTGRFWDLLGLKARTH